MSDLAFLAAFAGVVVAFLVAFTIVQVWWTRQHARNLRDDLEHRRKGT
jgi:uncharacterized membrane protein YccC